MQAVNQETGEDDPNLVENDDDRILSGMGYKKVNTINDLVNHRCHW